MNVANKMIPMTIEEFDSMEKDDGKTYELIDGVVLMAPSPSEKHQTVGGNIYHHSRLLLKETRCRAFYELDIRFNDDLLQPDNQVKCIDEEIPRIVFEIISPSSVYRDMVIKVAKYKEIGIAEYWIIDIKSKTVTVHDYVNGHTEIYILGDFIRSKAVKEIVLSVEDIFEEVD